MMPTDTDPLEGDYKHLTLLDIDWSPIPATVRGKQLDCVHLREYVDGPMLEEVVIGQSNANRRHVRPPKRWHVHPVINYVAWCWFVDRCETVSASKVHQYTIELVGALKQLRLAKDVSEGHFEGIVRAWALEAFIGAPNSDAGHHRQTAIRQFLSTGQLECEWGFSDEVAACLLGLKINNRITRGIHVLTLDDEYGPYTKAQRVRIEALLKSGELGIEDEALIRLHRFIGLRPLQTALLRESDLGCKGGVWHLAVPLVKGRYASGRRHSSRMREYKIPKDLVGILQQVIEAKRDNPLTCPLSKKDTIDPALRPLFKAGRSKERTLPRDPTDAEYYYHLTPAWISQRFLKMTKKGLTTKETDLRTGEVIYKPLRITAYRFRYSVGTLLAQKGASLRQIAVWLGHKGEESVRFYIKMAQEWWDHDFSLSASEQQQKAIAALSGALVDKLPKSADGEVVSCIPLTGNCVLPPGVDECPYDPLTSCVGCSSRKDTNEMTEESLKIIAQAIQTNEAELEFWRANSTAQDPLGMLTEREKLVDSFEILSAEWGKDNDSAIG